jgi:predicted kinase
MKCLQNLIILSGVSGAGKSTFAAIIAAGRDQWHQVKIFSTDDYFMVNGEYKFDGTKLPLYHNFCQIDVKEAMEDFTVDTIIVANTFTVEEHIQPYIDLAEKYEYNVIINTVENWHGSKSVHNVPDYAIERQKAQLLERIKL